MATSVRWRGTPLSKVSVSISAISSTRNGCRCLKEPQAASTRADPRSPLPRHRRRTAAASALSPRPPGSPPTLTPAARRSLEPRRWDTAHGRGILEHRHDALPEQLGGMLPDLRILSEALCHVREQRSRTIEVPLAHLRHRCLQPVRLGRKQPGLLHPAGHLTALVPAEQGQRSVQVPAVLVKVVQRPLAELGQQVVALALAACCIGGSVHRVRLRRAVAGDGRDRHASQLRVRPPPSGSAKRSRTPHCASAGPSPPAPSTVRSHRGARSRRPPISLVGPEKAASRVRSPLLWRVSARYPSIDGGSA